MIAKVRALQYGCGPIGCSVAKFASQRPDIKIDKIAKANKVTVLGTGVNPGFLMDAWPLVVTGVCQQVKRIKAVRVQDGSPRRGPFQKVSIS